MGHRSPAVRPGSLAALVAACLLLVACGGSARTPVPSSAASSAAPIEVTLGSEVMPDGSIPPEAQSGIFLPGDPIYVGVRAEAAPDPAGVEVVWLDPAGFPIARADRPVAAGARHLVFRTDPDPSWPEGEYGVEVRINGSKVGESDFEISDFPRGGIGGLQVTYLPVEVFYATDRAPTGEAGPEERFGPRRSRGGRLHLGVCRVSVPRDHRMGEIERPSVWKLEFRPDPERHMVLVDLAPLPADAYFRRLRSSVGRSSRKEVLVFVHGFNVSFAEAVLRTAQMAYDLGFDGAPVAYSWPSQDVLSPAMYRVDESNAEWTAPHLERFLAELAARSGASAVHLIAHSMGNRALTAALQRIAARRSLPQGPLFSQIVLTAPDVDADVFGELAREFARAGERVTLYASSQDRALRYSRQLHGGYPRAGDSDPSVVVVPGVDTVEVSGVDTSLVGHSYYGENRSILSDLFALLRDRKAPDQRFGLVPQGQGGQRYWTFRP